LAGQRRVHRPPDVLVLRAAGSGRRSDGGDERTQLPPQARHTGHTSARVAASVASRDQRPGRGDFGGDGGVFSARRSSQHDRASLFTRPPKGPKASNEGQGVLRGTPECEKGRPVMARSNAQAAVTLGTAARVAQEVRDEATAIPLQDAEAYAKPQA